MKVEERKDLLLQSLKQSFVDDYDVYKNIVEQINSDFEKLELGYRWTYDEFCVNFLNVSIQKLEEIDIFRYPNFSEFVKNFWKFNLIIIRTVIINKFEELGYDYEKNLTSVRESYFLDNPQLKN